MRLHCQNLTDNSSIFLHGRFWWNRLRCEWTTFKKSTSARLSVSCGGCENSITISICIPYLFGPYLTIKDIVQLKHERETGIAIHNQAIWIYPIAKRGEWRSADPWYSKALSWSFPWSLDWYSTEILEHKANVPGLAKTVWTENRKNRKPAFKSWNDEEQAKKSVSEVYDYTYKLKSGEYQHRRATVYVNRMTWLARWWPIIPIKKSQTCINVAFDGEVGEKTGSWKGGCTGCGYEMKFGETPMETLYRMERERKF